MLVSEYRSKGQGVLEEMEFESLPTGAYDCKIKDIESKETQEYGSRFQVTWVVQSPEAYKGRYLWDSFYMEHPDLGKRAKAHKKWDSFLLQVAGIGQGEACNPLDLLDKVCTLTIVTKEGKEGRLSTFINKRVPVEKKSFSQTGGISMPKAPTKIAEELNDDIPF
jgi:Protein of unknown function (DUF669)